MKGKLVKDISAGTIQVIGNQALGIFIFIMISRYLDKEVYGALNWSLAVMTFATTILSLRLEQVVVRNVAAGDDPSKVLTIFSGHVFISGFIFFAVLLIGKFLFPAFYLEHNLLLLVSISQLFTFFSLPFKQVAAGKEAFGWMAAMSSTANLIRFISLSILVLFFKPTIREVISIYIFSALIELLVCIYLVQFKLKARLSLKWSINDYFTLIRESIPQIGVVFLNACIGRIDWILLGLLSTTIITAEYTFAYRVFELTRLPIVILGPILFSRFSRLLAKPENTVLNDRSDELQLMIRVEMILATLLPLMMSIIWIPLVEFLTNHKYGAVNKTTFLILSLSIPFHYLINFFWTIQFSRNKLALIFRITAITCLVIVVGDFLVIPLYNARGAAVVYASAMVVEFLLYLKFSNFIAKQSIWKPLIACCGTALLTGYLMEMMDLSLLLKLPLAIILYVGLILITGQFYRNDIRLVLKWAS